VIAGFTGTREGMTERQKTALSLIIDGFGLFRHGDCIGADEEAAHVVNTVNTTMIIAHPPINPKLRSKTTINDLVLPEKEYLERDRDIVDNSDVLIAAPKSLTPEPRSGTWYTINYAKAQGKPIIILHP
jgi:hypothetical protein